MCNSGLLWNGWAMLWVGRRFQRADAQSPSQSWYWRQKPRSTRLLCSEGCRDLPRCRCLMSWFWFLDRKKSYPNSAASLSLAIYVCYTKFYLFADKTQHWCKIIPQHHRFVWWLNVLVYTKQTACSVIPGNSRNVVCMLYCYYDYIC